jgi:hypothetical protein
MRNLIAKLSFIVLLIATAASLPAQDTTTQAPAQGATTQTATQDTTAQAPAEDKPQITPPSKTFTSQDGHFSIRFAGTPKKETSEVKLADGASTTLTQYSVELDNSYVTYTIIYNDYPQQYANGNPQEILGSIRDGVIADKTLISDVPITLNGVPGRAFAAADLKKGWFYTIHYYLRGKRLYQLIIVNVTGHPAYLEDEFMNSFKIW